MNKRIEERLVLKKSVKRLISKIMITIIIFLIGMICVKQNPLLKDTIQKNLYDRNWKFQKMKSLYEKYFGNILSVDKIVKETEPVFSEKLSFDDIEKYQNGVKLKVSTNYMVPIIESGVVVYIGEKEGVGKTIIVEQVNGIETSYSNVNINNIKLYDYVEKGELLGETIGNDLILSFQKDGKYLDYKEYI